MKKNLLTIALLGLVTLGACKQDDNTVKPFSVEGVVPVELDNQLPTTLTVKIKAGTNLQEKVNVSTEGLPVGVTASVEPANGTPPFNATITFNTDLSTAPGKYLFTVRSVSNTANSGNATDLIVKKANYFTLGTGTFDTDSMLRIENVSGSHFAGIIKNVPNAGIAINFKSDLLPDVSRGIFNITNFSLSQQDVAISVSLGNNMNYISSEVNRSKLYFYNNNGKIGFKADSVVMEDVSTGATSILNADVREK